jgi:hypothetical protein
MDGNVGYVIAGYALTALALSGYVAILHARARAARRRADAMAARRRG